MFPCSADHERDWQPFPADPYSAESADHSHIHTSSVHNITDASARILLLQYLYCTSIINRVSCKSRLKTIRRLNPLVILPVKVRNSFKTGVLLYGRKVHAAYKMVEEHLHILIYLNITQRPRFPWLAGWRPKNAKRVK